MPGGTAGGGQYGLGMSAVHETGTLSGAPWSCIIALHKPTCICATRTQPYLLLL